MKKTKLLIATAALSLAAVAAGTVSTMAWFQASNSASVASKTIDKTISTADPEYSVGGDILLNVTVTRLKVGEDTEFVDSEKRLQLATWEAENKALYGNEDQAGFAFHYFDSNHVLKATRTPLSGNAGGSSSVTLPHYALYKVNVKAQGAEIGGIDYDADAIADLMDAEDLGFGITLENAKYTVASGTYSSGTYYEKNANGVYSVKDLEKGNDLTGLYTKAETRAKFFMDSSNQQAYGSLTDADGGTAFNANNYKIAGASISAATMKGAGYTFYFGMYVEGNNGNNAYETKRDTGAVPGDFTVTVAAV